MVLQCTHMGQRLPEPSLPSTPWAVCTPVVGPPLPERPDAIDHCVMAITSARASGRHTAPMDAGKSPAQTGGGEWIMITIITFALFAIALALFGLIALVVNIRTIDQSTLLSDLWKS
jgi:hypothetical protein